MAYSNMFIVQCCSRASQNWRASNLSSKVLFSLLVFEDYESGFFLYLRFLFIVCH